MMIFGHKAQAPTSGRLRQPYGIQSVISHHCISPVFVEPLSSRCHFVILYLLVDARDAAPTILEKIPSDQSRDPTVSELEGSFRERFERKERA